jgi:hypothetical protein
MINESRIGEVLDSFNHSFLEDLIQKIWGRTDKEKINKISINSFLD